VQNNLYIVWNETNNTGIPIIDEQHRAIISTINTLHYFIANKKELHEINSIIVVLDQYTKFHFSTEEGIMKDIGFPDISEHIKFHRALADASKKVSIQVKEENDPEVLLRFLRNWWLSHICGEDKKYADFLKEAQR